MAVEIKQDSELGKKKKSWGHLIDSFVVKLKHRGKLSSEAEQDWNPVPGICNLLNKLG